MKEKLLLELKDAMKNKDELKKNTISMLRAAILQIEKDEQKLLTDDDILNVVAKEVKKRRESLEEFKKVEREDLIESTQKEIEILAKYLPEQLTQEEIEKLVDEAISNTNATSAKDMGNVMKYLRPKTAAKADGKLVSNVVKEKLSHL